MTRVGVIGLGAIGAGIAASIARAGLELSVLDVRPEATARFSDSATVVTGPAEMAKACDAVVVAVVDDAQVREVVAGDHGVLSAAAPDTAVVVVSTVAPATVVELAELADAVGVRVVDCGVSGGPGAAEAGDLICMVGGEAEIVDTLRPVLDTFAATVEHMGPVGSGLVAKLARNVIQYGSWLAAYEGQVLAEAAGVDLMKLASIVRASDRRIGGASTLMMRPTVAPLGDDDDPALVAAMRAAAELAVKDLRLAVGEARTRGVDMPLAALAEQKAGEVFGIASRPRDDSRPPGRDARERGLAMMEEVCGFAVDPATVPGGFAAVTIDHLFEEIWTRPGLDIARRRLLTIGAVAAFGLTNLLEIQFASSMSRGELTAEQVREVVVHLAHYVGWPLATSISDAAERAISGHAGGTPSAGRQGEGS